MNITKEEVRRQLKVYMKKHNLKQYELARILNTTENQIWRWLNCKSKLHKGSIAILEAKGILQRGKKNEKTSSEISNPRRNKSVT